MYRLGITLAAFGLFCILRMDIVEPEWRKFKAQVLSPGRIDAYLKTHSVRKLQIGAGSSHKSDWLNTDIEPSREQVYLDATERFPLPDNAVHYVYSEHVIEHISYPQGLGMLKESYRVLAPGGKVRVATPNLMKFIGLFQETKSKEMQSYMLDKMGWHEWPVTPDPECYILNQQLRQWGHQFVYTPKLLRASLEAAGFKDIKELVAGESDDPTFRGVELRAFDEVRDVNRFETLVFEAVRPPVPATTAMNK
jgi:predicted SAM-dependent methyltransferase